MPIYNGTLQDISIEETKRYAGMKGLTDFPEEKIIAACREAQALCKPQGIFQQGAYDRTTRRILCEYPFVIVGDEIASHLAYSTSVVLMAATIGSEIESVIDSHFKAGNYTQGMLLDAAATAAVESIADQMNDYIDNLAANRGYATTWRFSPGYGDWPLVQQPVLLRACKGEEIGIQVSETCMLLPRKSITAVIGLMPEDNGPGGGCMSCSKTDCLSRAEE